MEEAKEGEKKVEDTGSDSHLISPGLMMAFTDREGKETKDGDDDEEEGERVSKEAKDIVMIACFADHSLALSDKDGEQGSVYAWGYAANGRLALGSASASGSETTPKMIPYFGPNQPGIGGGRDTDRKREAEADESEQGLTLEQVKEREERQLQRERDEAKRLAELADEPIVFSEEDERKARQANLDAKAPLEQHRHEFLKYLDVLSQVERQKMLVFKAIARRIDESQDSRSLTARKWQHIAKLKAKQVKDAKDSKDPVEDDILDDGEGRLILPRGFTATVTADHGGGEGKKKLDKDIESEFARGLLPIEVTRPPPHFLLSPHPPLPHLPKLLLPRFCFGNLMHE